jgi:hypothetical protein
MPPADAAAGTPRGLLLAPTGVTLTPLAVYQAAIPSDMMQPAKLVRTLLPPAVPGRSAIQPGPAVLRRHTESSETRSMASRR